jgi:protein phosphatase 1 regulatory subunit 7
MQQIIFLNSEQDIQKIEGLQLPNLKELFLHRNNISRIEGLEGAPRIRRLWLFQNNITSITGLHAVPELEECWLQGNKITSLQGIEISTSILSLAVAGNNISDFNDLHRLSSLTKLSALSLQDVHFGRCPIVDDSGYKNFCICYFPQLMYLDGVRVNAEQQKAANTALTNDVSMRQY